MKTIDFSKSYSSLPTDRPHQLRDYSILSSLGVWGEWNKQVIVYSNMKIKLVTNKYFRVYAAS